MFSVDFHCMTFKCWVCTSDHLLCVVQKQKWCGFGTTRVNGDRIVICMWFNSLCDSGAVWLTFAFIWPIYFAFSDKDNAVISPNFIIWMEKLNKMAFSLFCDGVCVRVCLSLLVNNFISTSKLKPHYNLEQEKPEATGHSVSQIMVH